VVSFADVPIQAVIKLNWMTTVFAYSKGEYQNI